MSIEPSVWLIGGPTASGKSDLALRLAERLDGVVINADSMQIYRGLEVLTAAPTEADRSRRPHLLYGVADPLDGWSAARWSAAATAALAALDGRPAVLVGGTGLYFRALTRGLAEIPAIPDAVRAQVRRLADDGEGALRAALAAADPDSGAAIAPGDRQRLARALEVRLATGRSIEAWRVGTRPALQPGAWRGVVVEADTATLHRRCAQRLEAMIAGGALEEVARVLALDPPSDSPALKALGFREFAAVVQGRSDRPSALAAAVAATRRYVKRQRTWFRHQTPDWTRIDVADPDARVAMLLGDVRH